VGNDAKQMIYSIINSEEEMNQQVLYMLAVGRFYSQGNNNASTGGTSTARRVWPCRACSADRSVSKSTMSSARCQQHQLELWRQHLYGDEGWNNAEYEGLLTAGCSTTDCYSTDSLAIATTPTPRLVHRRL
jgi:hypothetical protein